MPYCPIVGTLGFVLNPERSHVLMVHRIARAGDHWDGKYNGLGGKMESHEDVLTCIKREIHEEAGITCEEIVLRGTVNWTGFGPKAADWLGFVFLITRFTGVPFTNNSEGNLEWVKLEDIPKLAMWEGDRHFIPLVFDSDPRPFHGYMPYDNGRPLNWSYTRH